VINVWQHLSHTLQPLMAVLHSVVPFSWPQLCGTTHLQLSSSARVRTGP
jgi:hypothetical protein